MGTATPRPCSRVARCHSRARPCAVRRRATRCRTGNGLARTPIGAHDEAASPIIRAGGDIRLQRERVQDAVHVRIRVFGAGYPRIRGYRHALRVPRVRGEVARAIVDRGADSER